MNIPLKFSLPDDYDQKQLIDELSEDYKIRQERTALKRLVLYDTFDWRLYNKSLVLYESGKRLYVRELFSNEPLHGTDISSVPVFSWDFPDSDIKDLLKPIIKMRALFKLAEVHSRSRSYRILNPDEKTVARLTYDEIRLNRRKDSPIVAAYLWVLPVKGYPKYYRNLVKRLKKAGLICEDREDVYFKTLSALHKDPGSYSSKLDIQLEPDMRADEATKIILRVLLRVMKTNEDLIDRDWDTEFLHDYRVSIRRTRSALSQIKNVFPKQTTVRFKKDFSYLGKLSNQLRDLDVYLLKEDAYKAMLPRVFRDDIDPLFNHLHKKRSRSIKQVVNSIGADRYKRILNDWEAFLNEPPGDLPPPPNAEIPILALAKKRIYKQYMSTIKAGGLITENTEDEKLHELRIECKKLRYLMEFFSSLFKRKKITRLIKQLKQLQDNLGDFNDLSVQKEYLLNIAEELPGAGVKNKKALVAIGSLVGALDEEKRVVRDTFSKTFSNYASPSNMQLFRELFA